MNDNLPPEDLSIIRKQMMNLTIQFDKIQSKIRLLEHTIEMLGNDFDSFTKNENDE